jgi:hypothetical protein
MTALQDNLTLAEMYRQQDQANASLTATEVAIRFQKRRLWAERQSPGSSTGAVANLKALGADLQHIDEAGYNTALAAVVAAMAVLVADGASPTQAHVNTLNSAWGTLLTHISVRHHTASARTTFAADVATLVADGASPTQGHVNTANSDLTTLKASII